MALIMIVYAVTLYFSKAKVLLIYPIERYILIIIMILVALFAILSTSRFSRLVTGLSLVGMAVIWVILGWLHWVHPYALNTWVLSIGMAIYCLVTLYRGGYR